MLSHSDSTCAVIIAPPRAVQLLSYDRFATALSKHGVQTTISAEAPTVDDGVFHLIHTLAGDTDKANALLGARAASRTIPLEMMPDGASVAVTGGMPAAVLKDGYARWANGQAASPAVPSGLVVSTDLARLLDMPAAMTSDSVTVVGGSYPLPAQLAGVILSRARRENG